MLPLNSEPFILRDSTVICTPLEPTRSPANLALLFLKNHLWPKTCFCDFHANPIPHKSGFEKSRFEDITSIVVLHITTINLGSYKTKNLVLRAGKPHFLDKIGVCGKLYTSE